MQALLSKEIEEVENSENPNAPSLYRYTMYIESEGTTHRKKIQQDKDNVMDPMDLDFSFDDVDLGWYFNASTNALANLVIGKKTPPTRLESSASVATGSHESFQQAHEKLAIEDAKEIDKLLIKAEEAVRGNAGISFKAKKIVKVLPSTVLAKMHCQRLEELKAATEKYSAQLESITIKAR